MATARELLRAMDADGVDRAVIMGYGWCDPDVGREVNDYLLDAADRSKGRLIPFCSVNPRWGEAALREIEHCVAGGAKGIGELHFTIQGVNPLKDRRLPSIMALAAEHKLPVVVHGSEPVGHPYDGKGTTTPESLLGLIERFPKNTIVCAHFGGGLPFYAHMPEVRKALRNTYFDSAAAPFLYDNTVFATVAAAAGADKLLFGSDYPLVRPKRVAEQALKSLSSKRAVAALGENAVRLLKL